MGTNGSRRAVFKGRFQGHTGRPSRLSRRAIPTAPTAPGAARQIPGPSVTEGTERRTGSYR